MARVTNQALLIKANGDARRVATGPAIVRLPVPPSTNNLFANGMTKGSGRYPTVPYQEWRTEAGLTLNTQRPPRFEGRVEVLISVQNPKHPCDIDNRTKAVLDLLVEHGVLPGDDSRCVRRVTAQWADVVGCVVEIVPIAECAA